MTFENYRKLMYYKENIQPNTGLSYSDFRNVANNVFSYRGYTNKWLNYNTAKAVGMVPMRSEITRSVGPSISPGTRKFAFGIVPWILSGSTMLLLFISGFASLSQGINAMYGHHLVQGNLDVFLEAVNSVGITNNVIFSTLGYITTILGGITQVIFHFFELVFPAILKIFSAFA